MKKFKERYQSSKTSNDVVVICISNTDTIIPYWKTIFDDVKDIKYVLGDDVKVYKINSGEYCEIIPMYRKESKISKYTRLPIVSIYHKGEEVEYFAGIVDMTKVIRRTKYYINKNKPFNISKEIKQELDIIKYEIRKWWDDILKSIKL